MEEQVLNQAVEDISLIKGVIDKTNRSFAAFCKIFIYWGLLFIVYSIVNLWIIANKERMLDIVAKFPIVNYIFPVGLVALIAIWIYFEVLKKVPLIGLEKHLMKVWILVLLMNIIPERITIVTVSPSVDINNIVIQTNNFPKMLFSLAIGLIATSLFAGYGQLKKLGIIYIIISIISAYFMPMSDNTLIQVIHSCAIPFTFLYTGFFLKARQVRGN